eukprot:755587-Hanusia_phi.AAC.6
MDRWAKKDELESNRRSREFGMKLPDDIDSQPRATIDASKAVIDMQHLHQTQSKVQDMGWSSEDSLDEENKQQIEEEKGNADVQGQENSCDSQRQKEFLSQIDRILTMHENRGAQAASLTQHLKQGIYSSGLGNFRAEHEEDDTQISGEGVKEQDDLVSDVTRDGEGGLPDVQRLHVVGEGRRAAESNKSSTELGTLPHLTIDVVPRQQNLMDGENEEDEPSTNALTPIRDEGLEGNSSGPDTASALLKPFVEDASPQSCASKLMDLKLSFVAACDTAAPQERKEKVSQAGEKAQPAPSDDSGEGEQKLRDAASQRVPLKQAEGPEDDSDLQLSDTPPSSPSVQSSSSWGLPPFQVPEFSSSPASSRNALTSDVRPARHWQRASDEACRETPSRENYSSVLSSLRSLSEVPSIEMSDSDSGSDADAADERLLSMSRSDAEARDLDSMTELRVSDDLSSSLLHLRLEEHEAGGAAEPKWRSRWDLETESSPLKLSQVASARASRVTGLAGGV